MHPTQRSAKIYQFPVDVRAAAAASRLETKASRELRAADAPHILSGSGWYHDEAMRDAARPVKH